VASFSVPHCKFTHSGKFNFPWFLQMSWHLWALINTPVIFSSCSSVLKDWLSGVPGFETNTRTVKYVVGLLGWGIGSWSGGDNTKKYNTEKKYIQAYRVTPKSRDNLFNMLSPATSNVLHHSVYSHIKWGSNMRSWCYSDPRHLAYSTARRRWFVIPICPAYEESGAVQTQFFD
jgi:hypothetical protein